MIPVMINSLFDNNIDDLLNYNSTNLIQSSITVKSLAWKYEKEWRVCTHNPTILNNFTPYVLISNSVYPKSIYLGENIENHAQKMLVTIAKHILHIPVYKMKTKVNKNSLKLTKVLLSD